MSPTEARLTRCCTRRTRAARSCARERRHWASRCENQTHAAPVTLAYRSMGGIFTEVGSALARLIAVLMILCLVAPRAAVAQQTASVSHIGLLAIDTESHSREW